MSNLVRAWTNNKQVSDKASKQFLKYAETVKDQLIVIDDFIFDMNSLKSEIVLSRCLDCEKYQGGNCCKGNSYSMPDNNRKKLEGVSEDIIKMVGDSNRTESYYKYGTITRYNSTTTRGHKDGHCIFSYKDSDGCNKCAIHKWCLDNDRNPLEYKPYPCSLFPIEGILLPNGKTFVFCSCKETSNFTMFFYTLTRRPCVNEECMTKAYSNSNGKSKYMRTLNVEKIREYDLKKYMNPAYIEQKGILKFLCGDETYKRLVESVS